MIHARKGVVWTLLLPNKGEPAGCYAFSDEDYTICVSGEEERVYTTEKCCSFGYFIDLLVSIKNAFMRGNLKGDRGLRKNSGVEDLNTGNKFSGCAEEVSAMEERAASESRVN